MSWVGWAVALFVINVSPDFRDSKDAPQEDAEPVKTGLIYKNRPYGFESIFNPITVTLNAGIEQIQFSGESRKIFKFDYGTSFNNVNRNVFKPFGPINRLGWGRFLKTEIFPLSWTKDRAQWVPNYQLHLLGGGWTARGLLEWYEYHGFPYPWVFTLVNYQIYQWFNEMFENGKHKGDNTDAIADIWVFNTVGLLLFMNDSVTRFFIEELHFAEWSPQPSFNVLDGTLQNNSQRFTMKWFSPWSERVGLFYHFGTTGMAGLTVRTDEQYSISAAGGFRAQRLKTLDQQKNVKTADLAWTAGLFLDRNNTPLVSILASAFYEDLGSINIYPGILRIGPIQFGAWATLKTNSRVVVGLTTVYAPGLAVGHRERLNK